MSVSIHCTHSLIQRWSVSLLDFSPAGFHVDEHFPLESRCLPFQSTLGENEFVLLESQSFNEFGHTISL